MRDLRPVRRVQTNRCLCYREPRWVRREAVALSEDWTLILAPVSRAIRPYHGKCSYCRQLEGDMFYFWFNGDWKSETGTNMESL